MPNPSITAERLHAQLEHYRGYYNDLSLSKSTREEALRRVRELEAELDLPEAERTPNHNGQPAQPRSFGTSQFTQVTISRETLALLLAGAESYLEDLSSGLADGIYEEGEDQVQPLERAIGAATELLNRS